MTLSHPSVPAHSIAPAYTGRLFTTPVPALRLPDESMDPEAAYRTVKEFPLVGDVVNKAVERVVSGQMSAAAPGGMVVVETTMPIGEVSGVTEFQLFTKLVTSTMPGTDFRAGMIVQR